MCQRVTALILIYVCVWLANVFEEVAAEKIGHSTDKAGHIYRHLSLSNIDRSVEKQAMCRNRGQGLHNAVHVI